jgi:hypothetical protein
VEETAEEQKATMKTGRYSTERRVLGEEAEEKAARRRSSAAG